MTRFTLLNFIQEIENKTKCLSKGDIQRLSLHKSLIIYFTLLQKLQLYLNHFTNSTKYICRMTFTPLRSKSESSRSDASTALELLWPGIKLQKRRHMWLILLQIFSFALKVLFLGTSVFPTLFTNRYIPKFRLAISELSCRLLYEKEWESAQRRE